MRKRIAVRKPHRAQPQQERNLRPRHPPRPRCWCIERISHHRVPRLRQMNADLMRAPGPRTRLQQGGAFSRLQDLEMSLRFLAAAGSDLHAPDLFGIRFETEPTAPM